MSDRSGPEAGDIDSENGHAVHPLTQAQRLFAAGDDVGVRALAGALGEDQAPDERGTFMRLLGLAALRQGDAKAARGWLEDARAVLGDADATLNVALGGACLADGAFGTAETHFRRVLAQRPDAVGANIGLACTLERQNDRTGALEAWRDAMAAMVGRMRADSDPWMLGLPAAFGRAPVLEMAGQLYRHGDATAADRLVERVLAIFPTDAAALDLRRQIPATGAEAAEARPEPGGDAGHGPPINTDPVAPQSLMTKAEEAEGAGQHDRARTLFRKAGALAVDAPSPLEDEVVSLALAAADALRRLGDPGPAADLLARLAERRPHDPEVVRLRALTLHAAGQTETAVTVIEQTMESHGTPPPVSLLLVHASLLRRLDRPDAAAASCRRAIAANPLVGAPFHHLAQILEQAGRGDEAVAACHAALLRGPDQSGCHSLIARILERRNQIDPAIEHYARMLEHQPDNTDVHLALGQALLRRGDWEDGWEEYEWRVLKTDRPADSFHQTPWDGGPLDAGQRLLIWREEQGAVEELMFLRMAAAAREAANAPLVLEVDRRLVSLVARAVADATVVAAANPPAEETHAPDIGAQVPFGSLARLLGPDPADVITDEPSIAADAAAVAEARARCLADTDAELLVGVCWSPLNARQRPDRVVPLEAWAPVFSLKGIRFVSVQAGPTAGALETLRADHGYDTWIDQVPDGPTDLDALATRIAAMDIVVTADALTAHLTGCLARPGLVLLPFAAEWRWGLSGTRVGWYPTLQLARQTVPDDWGGPIRRVAKALRHYQDKARAKRASGQDSPGKRETGA
ncbi:tetratricopeptide repeat protein [Rhodospira trueperi]|uniref:Tetratricopeptide (TPR) repeat n=1 Tax=Rhodospira trueperi TaxID=69960 RepID=A0A1G7FJY0_9PROT|nr:tetratricopeptide repeat protein [Rhodospira trueperi]SDE76188.1 Tetratricopeptide (TPR) repeat [Rhodospira trueperi]